MFTAQPVEVFNYYAYGMMIPGFFSNATTDYRFGFNGMLRDDDVRDEKLTSDNEGRGNSYDFGARIHDPRVGRWLSLDPLMSKFPSVSSYNFSLNNPVNYIDPDGKQPYRNNPIRGSRQLQPYLKSNSFFNIRHIKIRSYGIQLNSLETILPKPYQFAEGYDGTWNAVRTSKSNATLAEGYTFILNLGKEVQDGIKKINEIKVVSGVQVTHTPSSIQYLPIGDEGKIMALEKAYQSDLNVLIQKRIYESGLAQDLNAVNGITAAARIEFQLKYGISPMKQFELQAKEAINNGRIKLQSTKTLPTIDDIPNE